MLKVYATFALQEQVGGRGEPFLQYWILEEDQNWHDVVCGDGGSYRSGGPADMQALEGETKDVFQRRVESTMKNFEEGVESNGNRC